MIGVVAALALTGCAVNDEKDADSRTCKERVWDRAREDTHEPSLTEARRPNLVNEHGEVFSDVPCTPEAFAELLGAEHPFVHRLQNEVASQTPGYEIEFLSCNIKDDNLITFDEVEWGHIECLPDEKRPRGSLGRSDLSGYVSERSTREACRIAGATTSGCVDGFIKHGTELTLSFPDGSSAPVRDSEAFFASVQPLVLARLFPDSGWSDPDRFDVVTLPSFRRTTFSQGFRVALTQGGVDVPVTRQISDPEGNFFLKDIPPGPAEVRLRKNFTVVILNHDSGAVAGAACIDAATAPLAIEVGDTADRKRIHLRGLGDFTVTGTAGRPCLFPPAVFFAETEMRYNTRYSACETFPYGSGCVYGSVSLGKGFGADDLTFADIADFDAKISAHIPTLLYLLNPAEAKRLKNYEARCEACEQPLAKLRGTLTSDAGVSDPVAIWPASENDVMFEGGPLSPGRERVLRLEMALDVSLSKAGAATEAFCLHLDHGAPIVGPSASTRYVLRPIDYFGLRLTQGACSAE